MALGDDPMAQQLLIINQVCSPDDQADYILNKITCDDPPPPMAPSKDHEGLQALNIKEVCSQDNPADSTLNQVSYDACSAQTTGDLNLKL